MKKDKIGVSEQVSFKEALDPSVAHHIERLHGEAITSKKAQRFVLSSGMHDEGVGQKVLTVKPDGSHTVEFEGE
jgi:hypothetical protein